MADKNIYWSKTALTGGAAGALDSIDGTALQDGEVAHVWIANALYVYLLDVDSGAAEASPTVITPDTNAGNKRWILQGVRTINVGSDADGDMYYRASGALARLAKGTADYKLFMNAAGTAPEWAAGSKVVTVTRAMTAASGDVSTNTVGFKPSALIAIHGIAATKIGGVGIADSSSQFAWTNQGALEAGRFHFSSGYLVIGWESDLKYQFGVMKTLDSSGFTITWTKSAAEPATQNLIIGVLCLR